MSQNNITKLFIRRKSADKWWYPHFLDQSKRRIIFTAEGGENKLRDQSEAALWQYHMANDHQKKKRQKTPKKPRLMTKNENSMQDVSCALQLVHPFLSFSKLDRNIFFFASINRASV